MRYWHNILGRKLGQLLFLISKTSLKKLKECNESKYTGSVQRIKRNQTK